MEVDKLQLKDWSKTTLDFYLGEVERVGEDVATSFYNQSDLSRVKECDLMIIGINPGCGCLYKDWELKNGLTPDFLYKGNPCFKGKDDKQIIKELEKDWNIWKKMHKMLKFSNKTNILADVTKFVMTNMVFFGTAKQKQIPSKINKEECAKKTQQLIDIIHPKVIVLLGKECRNLFVKLTDSPMDALETDHAVFYGYYNDTHVISIYHPSYYKYYTNVKMAAIGNIIEYVLDSPLKRIDKRELEVLLTKEINIYDVFTNNKQKEKRDELKMRIRDLQKMILKNCEKLSIFNGTVLCNELYTTIRDGKYVPSKDTIAVDLLFDENDCIIRLGTRRYVPEKTKEIAIAIDGVFIPGDTNLTASHWHVHAKIPQSTNNEKIALDLNAFIGKVKAYRDKEYPLNR